jgi:hypothetical protein
VHPVELASAGQSPGSKLLGSAFGSICSRHAFAILDPAQISEIQV